jgi:zinc transporter
MDDCEDQVVEGTNPELRTQLAQLRRRVIGFRRHLAPQREVMAWLQARPGDWRGTGRESDVRETANHLIRFVEELDAIRERAGVMQEELAGKLAERTSKIMYLLTILSGVFLPLGFLTGLLGVNVGGIPGSQHPWGFAMVCGILVGIVLMQVLVFRRLKWI